MSKNFKKKKAWHKIGGLWKNEEGKLSVALSLVEPVTLKIAQGDRVIEVELVPNDKGKVYLHLQKPEDEITALVANNVLSEAEGESRRSRLPESLKYNVILPPPRD
jgi:hypothetical protein